MSETKTANPLPYGGTTFTYDGFGNRVTKGSTSYFGDAYEIRGPTTIVHLFANGQRVVSIRGDGNTQYYHANHLGSASVVTDQAGKVEERIEYYPYGTYRTRTTGMSTSGFPKVNYTFTDQEDDETGFYNYKARLYDPLVGRFISADSLVPSPEDLQSFNRYSYAKNNPLVYTDPSGHDAVDMEDMCIWVGPGESSYYGNLSNETYQSMDSYFAYGSFTTGGLISLYDPTTLAGRESQPSIVDPNRYTPSGTPGYPGYANTSFLGGTNASFLFDFLTGNGDRWRYYPQGTAETQDMQGSPGADYMRRQYIATGCDDTRPYGYGTYRALWETVLTPLTWASTALQVGGFDGAAISDNGDGTITVRIANTAGLHSFTNGDLDDRTALTGPFTNIYQLFIWTEKKPAGCPK